MKRKLITRLPAILFIFFLEKGLLYFDKSSDYFAKYSHDTLLFFIIFGAIILFAITFYKLRKEKHLLFEADDELSMRRKYQAGYYAFYDSLWLWLLLFMDKDQFHSMGVVLGGGILISLIIAVISFILVRYRIYEEQN